MTPSDRPFAHPNAADELASLREQAAAVDKLMGVVELTLDGIISRANDTFLRMVGYERGEVVGQHHRLFAPPSFLDGHEGAQLWGRLVRGERVDGRYECLAKGGRRVWMQASYNPIRDNEGRPCKVMVYANDVSLHKLHGDLKAALDTAAANVMVADIDHNIVYGNESLAKMFTAVEPAIRKKLPGFSANRILGTNIDEFDPAPPAQRSLLDALRGAHASTLTLGDCRFDVVANPIFGHSGARLGTVLEWTRTPVNETR